MAYREKRAVGRPMNRGVSARPVTSGLGTSVGRPANGELGPTFKITFFRQLTNSHGKPHEVDLATVHVHDHSTSESAVAAAIKQFEQSWRLTRWHMLANRYEVEALA